MEPVRIKMYGLFPTTKRRYLIQVILAVGLMAMLMIMWLVYWQGIRQDLSQVGNPLLDRVIVFCNSLPAIVGVIAVLQILEASLALRAFARAEAAQASTASKDHGALTQPRSEQEHGALTQPRSPDEKTPG